VLIGIGLWFLLHCIVYWTWYRSGFIGANARPVMFRGVAVNWPLNGPIAPRVRPLMLGLAIKYAALSSACIMAGLFPSCRFPILDWIVISLFALSILLLPVMTVFKMVAAKQEGQRV